MPRDADQYDFFMSYARADNQPAAPGEPGWITAFVDALIEEHRNFCGDEARALVPFRDQDNIRSFDDWQHRLNEALAASRLLLAFLSPRYFASEWCQREWRTWIDLEIAKHILSSGVAPVYIVEVPGLDGTLSPAEVARNVAELCEVPASNERFVDKTAPVIHQLRQRAHSGESDQPFRPIMITCSGQADHSKRRSSSSVGQVHLRGDCA